MSKSNRSLAFPDLVSQFDRFARQANHAGVPTQTVTAMHSALTQLVAAVNSMVPQNGKRRASAAAPKQNAARADGLSANSTLLEFFDRWFLPHVLRRKETSEKTIGLYKNSLTWWKNLTGDPPLGGVDEFVLTRFDEGLREATYRRTEIGEERSLAGYTRMKHLKTVRTILLRTGPTTHPRFPAAELLARTPYFPVTAPRAQRPKPPFTIDEARRIFAAAARMTWRSKGSGVPGYYRKRNKDFRDSAFTKIRGKQVHLGPFDSLKSRRRYEEIISRFDRQSTRPRRSAPPDVPAPAWWKAFIATLYYTGLRSGTVLNLEWSMLKVADRGAYLEIPADAVTKTRKWRNEFLHPSALAMLEAIRVPGESKMLPFPFTYTHLAKRHDELLAMAGVEKKSPHCWRRTHATEIARLGAQMASRPAPGIRSFRS